MPFPFCPLIKLINYLISYSNIINLLTQSGYNLFWKLAVGEESSCLSKPYISLISSHYTPKGKPYHENLSLSYLGKIPPSTLYSINSIFPLKQKSSNFRKINPFFVRVLHQTPMDNSNLRSLRGF